MEGTLRNVSGFLLLFFCVFGSHALIGGNIAALWQPGLIAIVVGGGIAVCVLQGGFGWARGGWRYIGRSFLGARQGRRYYREFLAALPETLAAASQGQGASSSLDEVAEDGDWKTRLPRYHRDRSMFSMLRRFMHLAHAHRDSTATFDALAEAEFAAYRAARAPIPDALRATANTMAVLGLIATGLGVIKTIGSIGEPPEVFFALIGGAMAGFFWGLFLGPCLLAPVGRRVAALIEDEMAALTVMRATARATLLGLEQEAVVMHAWHIIPERVRPEPPERS